ncbi:hypothetical protein NY486_26045, partial [Enterobacter hormaechei]|nr:hypothetical protein [Enterobacter hormaechei]
FKRFKMRLNGHPASPLVGFLLVHALPAKGQDYDRAVTLCHHLKQLSNLFRRIFLSGKIWYCHVLIRYSRTPDQTLDSSKAKYRESLHVRPGSG